MSTGPSSLDTLLTPPATPKQSLLPQSPLGGTTPAFKEPSNEQQDPISPPQDVQPAILPDHHLYQAPEQVSTLSSSISQISFTSSTTSLGSITSVFTQESTSTTRSASPPEHFYAGLSGEGVERIQQLHATSQLYGTHDLGNGRRGAISGPSSNYYEGKYERGSREGRTDNCQLERGIEDDGGGYEEGKGVERTNDRDGEEESSSG